MVSIKKWITTRQLLSLRKGYDYAYKDCIDAVETAARFGIERNRAVNYNADSQGTQILYETISTPISAVRADAAIADDWSTQINQDFQTRKK